MEGAFQAKGASYVRWAAKMAVDLQTGVPWVMCKQTDAPDPVVFGLFPLLNYPHIYIYIYILVLN